MNRFTFFIIFIFVNDIFFQKFLHSSDNFSNISIESDRVIAKKDHSTLEGNIILRKVGILLNTEQIDVYNGNKNLVLNGGNLIKIKTNKGDYLYSKTLEYDNNKKKAILHDIHFFPSETSFIQVIAREMGSDGDNKKYYFKDGLFAICTLEDLILEADKKKDLGESSCVVEPSVPSVTNRNIDEIYKSQYRYALSFSSKLMEIDKTAKTLTSYDNIFRFFGQKIFSWPKLKYTLGNGGDSGLLMPGVSFTRGQFGLEIPFYWSIASNMDLTVSRSQYITYKEKTSASGAAYDTLDVSRQRESTNQFKFRHMVSDKYGFDSYYKISGMMTDWTHTIDSSTKLADLNAKGQNISGFRGYFDLESKIKLSKNLFFDADYTYVSDSNFMYIYKYDFRQTKLNKIGLTYVNEKSFLTADLIQMMPLMTNITSSYNPLVVPVIRGDHSFDRDKLGGGLYVRTYNHYTDRIAGMNLLQLSGDLGYNLPYEFKYGTRLIFDTLLRGQYDRSTISDTNAIAIAPGDPTMLPTQAEILAGRRVISSEYVLGNYLGMMENSAYLGIMGSEFNGFRAFSFNKIQLEKAFLLISNFGESIIEPKVAIRYNPIQGISSLIPNEGMMGITFNNYNAFSLMQSGGLGVYDSGSSVIYGSDFLHKFNKNIEFTISIAQSQRITRNGIDMMPTWSGYRSSMSDLIGAGALRIHNVNFMGHFRQDIISGMLRELSGTANYSSQYFTLGIMYNQFSETASFYGRKLQILTAMGTIQIPRIEQIKYFSNFKINGMIGYNLDDSPIPNYMSTNGIMMLGGGFSVDFACITIGVRISRSFITPNPNLPPITVARLIFAIKSR